MKIWRKLSLTIMSLPLLLAQFSNAFSADFKISLIGLDDNPNHHTAAYMIAARQAKVFGELYGIDVEITAGFGCAPHQIHNAATRAIDRDGVSAMIGFSCDKSTTQVLEVLDKKNSKIPLVITSPSTESIPNQRTFRILPLRRDFDRKAIECAQTTSRDQRFLSLRGSNPSTTDTWTSYIEGLTPESSLRTLNLHDFERSQFRSPFLFAQPPNALLLDGIVKDDVETIHNYLHSLISTQPPLYVDSRLPKLHGFLSEDHIWSRLLDTGATIYFGGPLDFQRIPEISAISEELELDGMSVAISPSDWAVGAAVDAILTAGCIVGSDPIGIADHMRSNSMNTLLGSIAFTDSGEIENDFTTVYRQIGTQLDLISACGAVPPTWIPSPERPNSCKLKRAAAVSQPRGIPPRSNEDDNHMELRKTIVGLLAPRINDQVLRRDLTDHLVDEMAQYCEACRGQPAVTLAAPPTAYRLRTGQSRREEILEAIQKTFGSGQQSGILSETILDELANRVESVETHLDYFLDVPAISLRELNRMGEELFDTSPESAVELWRAAGQHRHGPALLNLGKAYETGRGVKQADPETSALMYDYAHDAAISDDRQDDASRKNTMTEATESANRLRKACHEKKDSWCTETLILYATNRKAVSRRDGSVKFGRHSSEKLQFGESALIIHGDRNTHLKRHPRAARRTARVQHLPYRRNENLSAYNFEKLLRDSNRDILVFVHGFNNDFEFATRRAAQFAYDTGFEGLAVLFSWPSAGEGPHGYFADAEEQKRACPLFVEFLGLIAKAMSAEDPHRQIHVVAHSMGAELLFSALTSCAYVPHSFEGNVSQVLLAAPDIDTSNFRSFSNNFIDNVKNVTIYEAANDWALRAATFARWFRPRLGLGDEERFIFPRIDIIDATDVPITGLYRHAYVFQSKYIVEDAAEIIRWERAPNCRKWPIHSDDAAGAYWEISGLDSGSNGEEADCRASVPDSTAGGN